MLAMLGSFDRCNLMLRINAGNVRNQCPGNVRNECYEVLMGANIDEF